MRRKRRPRMSDLLPTQVDELDRAIAEMSRERAPAGNEWQLEPLMAGDVRDLARLYQAARPTPVEFERMTSALNTELIASAAHQSARVHRRSHARPHGFVSQAGTGGERKAHSGERLLAIGRSSMAY